MPEDAALLSASEQIQRFARKTLAAGGHDHDGEGRLGALYRQVAGRVIATRRSAWMFLIGLPLGALVVAMATGGIDASFASPLYLAVAGLVVGVGTRLGSGCTSGHGVCGVSRFSQRSVVATLTFMAFGIATVAVMNMAGLEVLP